MDFYNIAEKHTKASIEVYPTFKVHKSKDLMVRGGSFYAVWDEHSNLWATDEFVVQQIIDNELNHYYISHDMGDKNVSIKTMLDFSSGRWDQFKKYCKSLPNNFTQLDTKIVFSNMEISKKDFCSKKLSYPFVKGDISAYDEMMSILYSEEERQKIEWAIGSIIAGESKNIQKFFVFYGKPGTGKSTILNIIQGLFQGYSTIFEAKALGTASNQFATEAFRDNPLVAIQHDGDLSRIEDNTKLNSIVSHEEMLINEKYKTSYTFRFHTMLFMGTNKPVKITDAKSGLIRRLIDVQPTNNKIPKNRYIELLNKIQFELSGIAYHCRGVFDKYGKNYYDGYMPKDMMMQTDIFYNFVEENYHVFKSENGVTLTVAYEMYKTFCDESSLDKKMPKHKFREELKNYFKDFTEIVRVDGKQFRSYYSGFLDQIFNKNELVVEEEPTLEINHRTSILDMIDIDCKAQYANSEGAPKYKWDNVKTKLKSLDTKRLHYVMLPENRIVIDFDIRNAQGEKDLTLNLAAANKFPPTYAELSKSGKGVHLHYIYDGDIHELSTIYSEHIEIKKFTGNSSLRRKLTLCNNLTIATINTGLPLKGEKMINFESLKNEKAIRTVIIKCLRKEVHSATKPNIDFIYTILEDAYNTEMSYDVTDLRPAILEFALNSTNNAQWCVKMVTNMKFTSSDIIDTSSDSVSTNDTEGPLYFFDIECYPNLFLVCYKELGAGKKCVRLYNPKPSDIEPLIRKKLIGFNCRRYDNHMLYAALIGHDNDQLYGVSQRLIKDNGINGTFREAYNISYLDIYEMCSVKQSLKKWEIELGINHMEMDIAWDQPAPEELWEKIGDYCENDVLATEAVFIHNSADWNARQIIANISGLSVNDKTQSHAARIIFGGDRNYKDEFVYTDLSKEFPGYVYAMGKSNYKGVEISEGGQVYAEPGIYYDVETFDVTSEHPNSAIQLNVFGKYTANFKALVDARIAIKHGDIEYAKTLLNGALIPFLDGNLKDLSYSLKIIINIVYGMTSAKYPNEFNDPRNVDNIVAKRGALFMTELRLQLQKMGAQVIHIKTDSVKIVKPTDEIRKFVHEFGKKYGYEFETESIYEKICLVNNAVYVAKEINGEWTATGAEFKHPYIFKKLFTKEPINLEDMTETKQVQSGSMYLIKDEEIQDNPEKIFVGRIGKFIPVRDGYDGGSLMCYRNDKYVSVSGTKNNRWKLAHTITDINDPQINAEYYDGLIKGRISTIAKYGDVEEFMKEGE